MSAAVRFAVLLSSVAFGAGACRNSRSVSAPGGSVAVAPAGPVVVLHAGQRVVPFRVELARTDRERERGLMYRNHMDADAGMLFVFDHESPLTFWMKNTFIPLDMIFIGTDRRIVGIVEDAVPETETPRRVNGKSRYVLEIGGGMSRRLGVATGSLVEFQGFPGEMTTN